MVSHFYCFPKIDVHIHVIANFRVGDDNRIGEQKVINCNTDIRVTI